VLLSRQQPDLVLLDIRMHRQSGLDYAAELAAMPDPPLVIFVTAYDEHALTAFEVHALDYLLKPLDDGRLAQALGRAERMLQQRQQSLAASTLQAFVQERQSEAMHTARPALTQLVVRSVGTLERVAVSEVRWMTSAGNYVTLHLASGRQLLHRSTLSALEERLPPGEFLRLHRSAMVRPAEITGLTAQGDGVYSARLRDGSSVAVSERHLAAVRALFAC
jgi:two-component system LytT family response regulator